MWVKLLNNQYITRKGVVTAYHAGDWVSIGRQTAEQWIAGGCAIAIDDTALDDSVQRTSGIAVRGNVSDQWREKFSGISGLQLAIFDSAGIPDLPFTETLIWTTTLEPRLDLLLTGFNLLKKFQVVVPIADYTTLAAHIGTQDERDATEAVIRDLRVPIRDTRLVYIRRCADTRRLVEVWRDTLATCPNERLAFMQAMYTVKPVVCDVPASWAGKR